MSKTLGMGLGMGLVVGRGGLRTGPLAWIS
eukprot:COSAG04_NODE_5612_length_1553_cov_1.193948_2_plen_29_part_01